MRNVEIKARSTAAQQHRIRQILANAAVKYMGTDHQVDTYFKVPTGRLKLREGNIETCLISYFRTNQSGPKLSDFLLVPVQDTKTLKEALTRNIGVLQVVDKHRDIYFLENVKIHLDQVTGLGFFVEIEAKDDEETRDIKSLQQQCEALMSEFWINQEDLITHSYSDMLLSLGNSS